MGLDLTGLNSQRGLGVQPRMPGIWPIGSFGVAEGPSRVHRRVLSPPELQNQALWLISVFLLRPLGRADWFLFLEIRPKGAPFGLLAIRPLGRALLLGRFAHFAQG